MTTELLTKHQLADRLRIGPSMVRKLVRAGTIPEVVLSPRVRRFDLEAVMEALNRIRKVKKVNG